MYYNYVRRTDILYRIHTDIYDVNETRIQKNCIIF